MRIISFVRAIAIAGFVIALLTAMWTTFTTKAVFAGDENQKLDIYDNCDPRDPAWASVGGCDLDPSEGDVTLAEFGSLLMSPLSTATIGHPSWRFEPSYLRVDFGKRLKVENEGGRDHTFTEVVAFGGGRVGGLNVGLVIAPECVLAPGTTDPTLLHPEQSLDVSALGPGLHKFQCCIHPWMRSAVRVEQPK